MCGAALMLMTACKKEVTQPASAVKRQSGTANAAARPVYQEGIMSFDSYNSSTVEAVIGYYRFWGPSIGQQPPLAKPISPSNSTVFAYGATAGNDIVAYKTTSNTQEIQSFLYGAQLITVNSGANPLYAQIEEIEILPGTNQVFAIAQSGNAKVIYSIDMTNGFATPLSVNGGSSNIFNNTSINGYKWGSIAFVPDGSGGWELVYSHESNVYASSGVVSWHFTISGTNLTSNVPAHHTYTGLPAGTGINTTYGNGKLYFARNGSSNALYSLSLTAGVNTVNNEGLSITNTNDFGYYRAF